MISFLTVGKVKMFDVQLKFDSILITFLCQFVFYNLIYLYLLYNNQNCIPSCLSYDDQNDKISCVTSVYMQCTKTVKFVSVPAVPLTKFGRKTLNTFHKICKICITRMRCVFFPLNNCIG